MRAAAAAGRRDGRAQAQAEAEQRWRRPTTRAEALRERRPRAETARPGRGGRPAPCTTRRRDEAAPHDRRGPPPGARSSPRQRDAIAAQLQSLRDTLAAAVGPLPAGSTRTLSARAARTDPGRTRSLTAGPTPGGDDAPPRPRRRRATRSTRPSTRPSRPPVEAVGAPPRRRTRAEAPSRGAADAEDGAVDARAADARPRRGRRPAGAAVDAGRRGSRPTTRCSTPPCAGSRRRSTPEQPFGEPRPSDERAAPVPHRPSRRARRRRSPTAWSRPSSPSARCSSCCWSRPSSPSASTRRCSGSSAAACAAAGPSASCCVAVLLFFVGCRLAVVPPVIDQAASSSRPCRTTSRAAGQPAHRRARRALPPARPRRPTMYAARTLGEQRVRRRPRRRQGRLRARFFSALTVLILTLYFLSTCRHQGHRLPAGAAQPAGAASGCSPTRSSAGSAATSPARSASRSSPALSTLRAAAW